VIAGYTVVVDHRKAGRPIQAFTEVRFAGTADLKEIKETAIQLPEVQAVFTTAGDPDALVWLQVPDVERLGQVIEQLRRRGRVTGTKTLIVLDTWSRHRAFEPDRGPRVSEGEQRHVFASEPHVMCGSVWPACGSPGCGPAAMTPTSAELPGDQTRRRCAPVAPACAERLGAGLSHGAHRLRGSSSS
jgi:hypothetical protein